MRFTRSAEGALNFEQPPNAWNATWFIDPQVLPFGT